MLANLLNSTLFKQKKKTIQNEILNCSLFGRIFKIVFSFDCRLQFMKMFINVYHLT